MRLHIRNGILMRSGLGPGFGLGAAGSTLSPSQISVANMVVAAADQYGVDPYLALAVASHESGFTASAVNPSGGAAGVMQLLPSTSSALGVSNPLDAQQNIDAGVSALAQLLDQYGGNEDLALWAYSNGPASVTAGGGNVANAPAQAQGLISYANSYTPQSGIDLSAVSAVASSSSSSSTAPDSGLDLTGDATDDSGDDGSDDGTTDNTNLYIAAGVVGIVGLMLAAR